MYEIELLNLFGQGFLFFGLFFFFATNLLPLSFGVSKLLPCLYSEILLLGKNQTPSPHTCILKFILYSLKGIMGIS